MRKLLFVLSIFIFSSCESKFDGLQGGIFIKDRGRATATFDDDKAYFTVQHNANTSFYLDFSLFESNPKIIDNFNKLFEKYNLNQNFHSTLENKTLRYVEINEEMDSKISQSRIVFKSSSILQERSYLNPTGKKIMKFSNTFKFEFLNNFFGLNLEEMIKEINYQLIQFKYSVEVSDDIDFVFDYERVGQNQILLSKALNELNYSHFKRELEILINKYESDGCIIGRKTILNVPSFIQANKNDYLKSNYYLNKVEKGYRLKNLEHSFGYTELR